MKKLTETQKDILFAVLGITLSFLPCIVSYIFY